MGFIYDIRHAALAENIAVYIIVIYWTSCSALQTADQRSHFKCTTWALVLGAVHACCIERQLITLQLELAGGQLELELELAI